MLTQTRARDEACFGINSRFSSEARHGLAPGVLPSVWIPYDNFMRFACASAMYYLLSSSRYDVVRRLLLDRGEKWVDERR